MTILDIAQSWSVFAMMHYPFLLHNLDLVIHKLSKFSIL